MLIQRYQRFLQDRLHNYKTIIKIVLDHIFLMLNRVYSTTDKCQLDNAVKFLELTNVCSRLEFPVEFIIFLEVYILGSFVRFRSLFINTKLNFKLMF